MGVDRVSLIRGMVDWSGKGLEIGPSHSPLFPKSGGFNVETLDYADADTLRRLYTGQPVDIDAIEHVDYVSDGRPIHEVVQKNSYYDYVVSSHTIEHVTDFLGYFQSCEALLTQGGCAVLAIPDKRYVFDALRFPSTTGDVLEAWSRSDKRHSLSRVFDFFSSYATLENLHTWDNEAHGVIKLENDIAVARHWFDIARRSSEYVDVHAWTLTPASLRLIIRDLNYLGLLNLRIAELYENGTFEFYVKFSRDAQDEIRDRADLVRDVHREQLASSRQIVESDTEEVKPKTSISDNNMPAEKTFLMQIMYTLKRAVRMM